MTLHFKDSEFYCKCGKCDKILPDKSIRILLEMLHVILSYIIPGALKIRIVVKSGSRCRIWNTHEGGKISSRHIQLRLYCKNDAADIKCYFLHEPNIDDLINMKLKKSTGVYWIKIETKIIYDLLDKRFPESLGLGLYKTFNHIDTRETKARWTA